MALAAVANAGRFWACNLAFVAFAAVMPSTNDERSAMLTEPAFTETELALRWNISIKTLQRWRSEERGPPYFKLSKAVRYAVAEIVAYEQANRQGMPNDAALPPLTTATPVVEPQVPAAPEPKRYYLNEAFALIAQYGSLAAAEAALTEAHDETQG
ncbi:helix-turn-helix domain-containing protein [Cupriavidus pauculus]|nr:MULTISPECIES: helix-turn-helix domain-containing protein [Burkholderiaceae]MCM3604029.1 helix-turn-helix domain-containing protein [Cupriavidus pauculus]